MIGLTLALGWSFWNQNVNFFWIYRNNFLFCYLNQRDLNPRQGEVWKWCIIYDDFILSGYVVKTSIVEGANMVAHNKLIFISIQFKFNSSCMQCHSLFSFEGI